MSQKRSTKAAKPTISIVGAGRLGTALAMALSEAGYGILALVGQRSSSARAAARLIGSPTIALGFQDLRKLPPAGLILIAVPDDAIAVAAQELSLLADLKGSIVLHTSGALSSKLLSPLAAQGSHVGSIHPLVSVSDPKTGAGNLRGAYYCLEGDTVAVKFARQMVRDLGGQSFSITPEKKALYHAAAVMSSGHLVALLDLTLEMLEKCGLGRKEAKNILMPLVVSTVNNLQTSDTEGALTGTFARGDLQTAAEHIKALEGDQLRGARTIYKLLGQRSLEIAARRGVAKSTLRQLERALAKIDD